MNWLEKVNVANIIVVMANIVVIMMIMGGVDIWSYELDFAWGIVIFDITIWIISYFILTLIIKK